MRLAEAIQAVKDGLSFCRQCRNIAEGELCEFCRDPKRDRSKILVVEEPSTLYAVERAGDTVGCITCCSGCCPRWTVSVPSDIRGKSCWACQSWRGGGSDRRHESHDRRQGHRDLPHPVLKPHHIRVTRIAYGIPVGMDVSMPMRSRS